MKCLYGIKISNKYLQLLRLLIFCLKFLWCKQIFVVKSHNKGMWWATG